jgi:hypothetical protein
MKPSNSRLFSCPVLRELNFVCGVFCGGLPEKTFFARVIGIMKKEIHPTYFPKAKASSYSSERTAACRYFSGKSCGGSSWAATYGNQVMAKAASIQETMIDPLQNT